MTEDIKTYIERAGTFELMLLAVLLILGAATGGGSGAFFAFVGWVLGNIAAFVLARSLHLLS